MVQGWTADGSNAFALRSYQLSAISYQLSALSIQHFALGIWPAGVRSAVECRSGAIIFTKREGHVIEMRGPAL